MNKSSCKGCGKEIVFLVSPKTLHLPPAKQKRLPINAETVGEGETVYMKGVHISHFSDCPQADKFRRRKDET